MARFSSAYKQTAPTRRIVQGENSCEKGMYWTNSAAGQGYVHTLLNYEIDQLSFTVQVAGGLHVTDTAAGCTYLDRATFGEGEANIVVLQGRNEYNLRAFEGITNIISANKLTIKNNQTLEEKLRQQGFTADDVVCYKLLTYNPVNHRLMSVTLIQAKRDKYFVVDNTYNLRRINSNPISCGFSEVWETLDGQTYVSNKLDYHPNGSADYFVPRARRNSYDETFGQTLHSPLYMQTVPNCEGYGNKTFCFTKKKQTEITGEIKDTTVIKYKDIVKTSGRFFRNDQNGDAILGFGYRLDDVVSIEATKDGATITPERMIVSLLRERFRTLASGTISMSHSEDFDYPTNLDWNHFVIGGAAIPREVLDAGETATVTIVNIYGNSTASVRVYKSTNSETGATTIRVSSVGIFMSFQVEYLYIRLDYGIGDVNLDTQGVFNGTLADYPDSPDTFKITVLRDGQDITNQLEQVADIGLKLTQHRVVDSTETPEVTTEDVYFKHINTGLKEVYNASLNNKAVPVDAFRYGILMTGCAVTPSTKVINATVPQTLKEPNKLWNKALTNLLVSDLEEPVFNLNLADGTLSPTSRAIMTNINLTIQALPYLDRGVANQPNTTFEPSTVFENVEIANWGRESTPVHPSVWLKKDILNTLRIGQGFRIAAYCEAMKDPARSINTLREDPLNSAYYKAPVKAVFVLDYVWTGTTWDFSFVDTSVDMYDANGQELTLVENWELNGKDELGNTMVRHYAWLNNLAFTDVVSENNVERLAKHTVDDLIAPKMVYNKALGKPYRGSPISLTQDINTTIEANFDAEDNIKNNSKFADISYGHFSIEPKALTPGEAALWGYNMLSNTPYTFECINTPGTQTAALTGVILKQAGDNSKVLLKPVVNTPGSLEIYYQSDRSYFEQGLIPGTTDSIAFQLSIEYKNPADDWRELKVFTTEETTLALSTGVPIRVPFTGADEITLVRVTLRDLSNQVKVPNASNTAVDEVYLTVSQIITTLSYTKDTTKVEPSPEVYDLGSATGMTYWKGRLVLWGVLNAENMLFMSEPNEPEYFAYPNGVDIFEENVVHVVAYSDALVVFTSTKLWRIDLNADGLSWTKTLLQQNLRIVDKDIPYITILKNMLFFKSDKQFYMLVPSKTSTVGELTIAPISKAIKDFLINPFAAIRDITKTVYPELVGEDYKLVNDGTIGVNGNLIEVPAKPITDYLIKYGVHTEQNRIMVDWWFDLTDWKQQVNNYGTQVVQHDITQGLNTSESASYLPKEYWLVQLIYDTETYSWTMRTHTTNSIGVFIADAVNQDTDFLSLTFCPEPLDASGNKMFDNNAFATWGLTISHRRKPADKLLSQFSLGQNGTVILEPTYPRFQVFDTGYKEVSSPSLKKRFREIQLNFEPSPDTEEGLRAAFIAAIDGNIVMSAVSQEIIEETETDPITGTSTIIKVVDRINLHNDALFDPDTPAKYVPLPYIVDGELSNTFVLDSSSLTDTKHIKIRRQINGKGYLARLRFVNITHANYALTNYAFVYHNKNSR